MNQITISGDSYNKNKAEYKKILKKYGYKWKGSYFSNIFKWINPDGLEITADYIRNNEVTESVSISLQGSEEFIKEVLDVFNIDENTSELKVKAINDRYDKEIKYHKKSNAPSGFIKAIENRRQTELGEARR